MSYLYDPWGRQPKKEPREFHEKAYLRASLPAWEARWHKLSPEARRAFLSKIQSGAKKPKTSSTTADPAAEAASTQLVTAGFLHVGKGGWVTVSEAKGLADFVARLRLITRVHLLGPTRPGDLEDYVRLVYYSSSDSSLLMQVLDAAEIHDTYQSDQILKRYVRHHCWPCWVAKSLTNNPLAKQLLDVVQNADGPLPLAELPDRLKEHKPEQVRAVFDVLLLRLAVVEDLDPKTAELMVGLLPAVREDLNRAQMPRVRPPLQVCAHPKEFGPESSVILDDLRGTLLEIASEPPRLRQDQSLFQKEIERFMAQLAPLPAWLLRFLGYPHEDRLNRAAGWARSLGLIRVGSDEVPMRMQLTESGRKWLSHGLEAEYAALYGYMNKFPDRKASYAPSYNEEIGTYTFGAADDHRFLGVNIAVLGLTTKRKRSPSYRDANLDDHLALRNRLDKALNSLELGVFYRLDSISAHMAFGEHNPLNLGSAMERVAVYLGSTAIPPLEERREDVGRVLIETFIRARLLPMGCVQAAIDADGNLCIARRAHFDAYFGREMASASAATVESRVVIQPDFSVIVIGLNSAPAADLAPFCERAAQRGGQGATLFKITRASVVKAVSHGLKPAEIMERLRRHGGKSGVPANVLREVEEWSNWVRNVELTTLTVLRCPDDATADRVMAALKKQKIERISPTLLGLDEKNLSSADRAKLRAQGIIVQGQAEARAPRQKSRRRRW